MVFPIHDGRPLDYVTRPYVTWALIAVNVIVYFALEGGGIADVSQARVYEFGLIPAVVADYVDLPAELWVVPGWFTLVTYAFLHGDIWHLLGNMVFLWVFADNIEDDFGHARFLLFYLLCAIGAGLVFILSDPQSQIPLVGASGAIAGVVAAYLILHPKQKVWVLVFARIPLRLPAFWILGFWVLFQLYAVLVAGPGEQVAWWAHVGGLVTGAILVLVLRRRGVPLFDRHPAPVVPPRPHEVDDDGTPL